MFKLYLARQIADEIRHELLPYCVRAEIAGSIRRQKPLVGDIEIVAIPKPYGVGLFESGIASVVNRWVKVKGDLPCKYTQRILPEGIKLDLFFATPENWGTIFAIRTGSAEFSHEVLASTWASQGFRSKGGILKRKGIDYKVQEERDLFSLLGLAWVEPRDR